jgi:hypothetical protein
MFESLESRQLYSVTTSAPLEEQTAPAPVEQTVTVDARKSGGTSTSGTLYLVFRFGTVFTTKID